MEVTINYNGQAVAVEVTLEVYEFLDRADHKAENLSHEQRRYWDGREFDEYIVATEGVGIYGETPEEYLCRMETLGELMAVLDTCTEAQRRRFLLYALDGLTLAEIGTVCGCSKVSVYESTLTERGEMWEQYNQYKSIHKQLAKVKPEKREQFEQRHSRELILYDAAARYLKELKDSGEAITPKAWQLEIDQLAAGKQTDTLAMKSMREDLKAVERLRKTAEQLSRQERDKSHDREPER